jgi:hypothetical protein
MPRISFLKAENTNTVPLGIKQQCMFIIMNKQLHCEEPTLKTEYEKFWN